MFASKKKISFSSKLRRFFWPSLGLKRYFRYLFYRIIRIKDTSYSLACGLACGIAVSFTPLWGIHIIIGIFFAFLLKGNIIATIVGTLFGNPLTFAIIIPINIFIGRLILNIGNKNVDTYDPSSLNLDTTFISNLVDCFTTDRLDGFICTTYAPMLVGGTILMIIFWIVSFSVFYFIFASIKKIKYRISVRRSDKKR